jgi:hypothetical protein
MVTAIILTVRSNVVPVIDAIVVDVKVDAVVDAIIVVIIDV